MGKSISKPLEHVERVILFAGRFQPFHLGHMLAIKKAYEQYNMRVFIIQIFSSNKNSPFNEDVMRQYQLELLKNYNDVIANIVSMRSTKERPTFIPSYIQIAREHGYEPVAFICGQDRNYQIQLNYLADNEHDALSNEKIDTVINDFKLITIDDRSAGYSGTIVRNAIKNDDFETYQKNMPELFKNRQCFENLRSNM